MAGAKILFPATFQDQTESYSASSKEPAYIPLQQSVRCPLTPTTLQCSRKPRTGRPGPHPSFFLSVYSTMPGSIVPTVSVPGGSPNTRAGNSTAHPAPTPTDKLTALWTLTPGPDVITVHFSV